MKNRLLSFAALSFLLIAFVLALAPVVRAGGVDDKIQALENELARLKSEQMELKKEAVAAAAALPTFSYRPGNGVNIEAADKAWSIQLSHETDFRMTFSAGEDQAGRTLGEVNGRRFRQEWMMCLNNCFYVWHSRLDLDGFGQTSALQRGQFEVHYEQVNPWLPTFYLGMDIEGRINLFRQGSSATGAQGEYDLMSRNNGFNTGRTGNGWGLRWDEMPLIPAIGIPGRGDANVVVGAIGAADDGLSTVGDWKDVSLYFRIDPFSEVKNPWISGFSYSIGVWFCVRDGRDSGAAGSTTSTTTSGCVRNRVQDDGPAGRQTLFDSGGFPTTTKGLQNFIFPGIQWKYGPYTLRAVMGFMNYNVAAATIAGGGGAIDQKARDFLIGHDLFLWSPKGPLTGSASDPGSVLGGYHFERNDYSCGHTRPLAPCAAGGEFSRNRVIRNEWDLWYFFMPQKSIGIMWMWYDASNLRGARGQALQNLGIKGTGCGTADGGVCTGKGGSWLDTTLALRVNF